MNNAKLLAQFDAAGDALAAIGETEISLTLVNNRAGRFSVAVQSEGSLCRDVVGLGDTPRAALAQALSLRSEKNAAKRRDEAERAAFEAFRAEQARIAA